MSDIDFVEKRLEIVREAIRQLSALNETSYNKDGYYHVTRVTIENKYFGYAQYNNDVDLSRQVAGMEDFTLPLTKEIVAMWIDHLKNTEKTLKEKQIKLLEEDLDRKRNL